MTHIAPRLRRYLNGLQVHYDVSVHARTASAGETAQAAHVPGDSLAKGVLLADDQGPLLAVLKSTHHISVERLNRALHRDLRLVEEDELASWFSDCSRGAVPIAGGAYGLAVVVDNSLDCSDDVFFEAGDHRHLVHVDAIDFERLMATAPRASFSIHN